MNNPHQNARTTVHSRELMVEGAHDPIVDQDVWEAVQAKLIDQSAKNRGRTAASAPSPLAGKIVDETGDRLTPTTPTRRGGDTAIMSPIA